MKIRLSPGIPELGQRPRAETRKHVLESVQRHGVQASAVSAGVEGDFAGRVTLAGGAGFYDITKASPRDVRVLMTGVWKAAETAPGAPRADDEEDEAAGL